MQLQSVNLYDTPYRRPARDSACAEGHRQIFAWLQKNYGRRHYVRAAFKGELSDGRQYTFPPAIICAQLAWSDPWAIQYRLLKVAPELVDACREDRGEEASRVIFEFAEHHPALWRDELISLGPKGLEVVGSSRTLAARRRAA